MTGTTASVYVHARVGPWEPWLQESVLTAFPLCELLITATFRVGVRADAGLRTPFVASALRLAKQTQLHTTAVLGRWRQCGAARLLACGSRHASRRRAHSRCRTRARRRARSRRCRSCCVRTCGPSSCAILSVTLSTARRLNAARARMRAHRRGVGACVRDGRDGARRRWRGGEWGGRGCLSKRTLQVWLAQPVTSRS